MRSYKCINAEDRRKFVGIETQARELISYLECDEMKLIKLKLLIPITSLFIVSGRMTECPDVEIRNPRVSCLRGTMQSAAPDVCSARIKDHEGRYINIKISVTLYHIISL